MSEGDRAAVRIDVGSVVVDAQFPQYRQTLGRDAQEYALAEFTWPAVAGKYLEVYRE